MVCVCGLTFENKLAQIQLSDIVTIQILQLFYSGPRGEGRSFLFTWWGSCPTRHQSCDVIKARFSRESAEPSAKKMTATTTETGAQTEDDQVSSVSVCTQTVYSRNTLSALRGPLRPRNFFSKQWIKRIKLGRKCISKFHSCTPGYPRAP